MTSARREKRRPDMVERVFIGRHKLGIEVLATTMPLTNRSGTEVRAAIGVI